MSQGRSTRLQAPRRYGSALYLDVAALLNQWLTYMAQTLQKRIQVRPRRYFSRLDGIECWRSNINRNDVHRVVRHCVHWVVHALHQGLIRPQLSIHRELEPLTVANPSQIGNSELAPAAVNLVMRRANVANPLHSVQTGVSVFSVRDSMHGWYS